MEIEQERTIGTELRPGLGRLPGFRRTRISRSLRLHGRQRWFLEWNRGRSFQDVDIHGAALLDLGKGNGSHLPDMPVSLVAIPLYLPSKRSVQCLYSEIKFAFFTYLCQGSHITLIMLRGEPEVGPSRKLMLTGRSGRSIHQLVLDLLSGTTDKGNDRRSVSRARYTRPGGGTCAADAILRIC